MKVGLLNLFLSQDICSAFSTVIVVFVIYTDLPGLQIREGTIFPCIE